MRKPEPQHREERAGWGEEPVVGAPTLWQVRPLGDGTEQNPSVCRSQQ